MQSRLTGMGLLSNVQHPLERLGELVDAEKRRQRAIVIAERWRIAQACLVGASVGGSLFATAVVSYAMLSGEPDGAFEATGSSMPSVALETEPSPPPIVEASTTAGRERPMLWVRAELDLVSNAVAQEPRMQHHAGVSMQAQAIASLGAPLQSEIVAVAALEADIVLAQAEAAPQTEVRTVGGLIEDVQPLKTLMLSGLPSGSEVENGIDLGDGTIVLPGDGAGDIDVKLPDRVRELVRAEVEMVGPDGTRASGFALTIRPSGAKARAQRAQRSEDDDEEPRKVRRKKQRAKALEPAVAKAAAPPAKEWASSEQPSYLGRGDVERQVRRDRSLDESNASLSRPRGANNDEDKGSKDAKGFSVFGLFGQ